MQNEGVVGWAKKICLSKMVKKNGNSLKITNSPLLGGRVVRFPNFLNECVYLEWAGLPNVIKRLYIVVEQKKLQKTDFPCLVQPYYGLALSR